MPLNKAHATETGICSGLMSHLTRMQTLPLPASNTTVIIITATIRTAITDRYLYTNLHISTH